MASLTSAGLRERFRDRRELAVVCLAGSGAVTVDAVDYKMAGHDVLYVGSGSGQVTFEGADARFYLVSTPAHAAYPTSLAQRDGVDAVRLGDAAHANVRTIRKYIHADGIRIGRAH